MQKIAKSPIPDCHQLPYVRIKKIDIQSSKNTIQPTVSGTDNDFLGETTPSVNCGSEEQPTDPSRNYHHHAKRTVSRKSKVQEHAANLPSKASSQQDCYDIEQTETQCRKRSQKPYEKSTANSSSDSSDDSTDDSNNSEYVDEKRSRKMRKSLSRSHDSEYHYCSTEPTDESSSESPKPKMVKCEKSEFFYHSWLSHLNSVNSWI